MGVGYCRWWSDVWLWVMWSLVRLIGNYSMHQILVLFGRKEH